MGVRVAVRVDASPQIGIGHVMRCLTLAQALGRSAQVRFISRHLPAHLANLIRSHGFECRIHDSIGALHGSEALPHAHWLGTAQAADAEDTIQALADQEWDWVVVDHYALDAEWEARLRTVVPHVFVVDDLADRRHDCDVLLDQNLYPDMGTRYQGKVGTDCRTLLGPRYALVRREFPELRGAMLPRNGQVGRLLVCFGGIDGDNFTALALDALVEANVPGMEVDVVIGTQHPCREAIRVRTAAQGYSCHVQTDRLASMMAAADLAFGASGSTSWERCCLGLPTICLATALNQVAIGRGLEHAGAVVLVGDAQPVTAPVLADAFASLLRDPGRVRAISQAALDLVDGQGAGRVSQEISRKP
jgi:UDP-2,4-diacetamido-2,4,6-trideoxy-beta-L-altropyranose hydrolase